MTIGQPTNSHTDDRDALQAGADQHASAGVSPNRADGQVEAARDPEDVAQEDDYCHLHLTDGRPLIVWDKNIRTGVGVTGCVYQLDLHNSDDSHFVSARAPHARFPHDERHTAIDGGSWESFNKWRIIREAAVREAVRILLAMGGDLLSQDALQAAKSELADYPALPSTWIPKRDVIAKLRATLEVRL